MSNSLSFCETTIGDTCYVTDGAHAKVERQSGGVLYLTSKNIGVGSLKLDKVDYISEADYERLFCNTAKAQRRLQDGDIIIGIIGTFGNAYRYKKTDRFGISSAAAIIRPNSEILNPDFLYYVITSPQFRSIHESFKSGSVQGYTNIPTLKQLPFKMPPLQEQCRISDILKSMDDKIELNRQISKTLEAIAQALFKSWFVDFDPVIDNALAAGNEIPEALLQRAEKRKAFGNQRKPLPPEVQSLFPDRFVFTDEMGWLPEGWVVKTVEDIVERLKIKKRYKKKDVTHSGRIPVYEQGSQILLGYHDGEAQIDASESEPAFIFGDHTCVTKLSVEPFSISENVIALKGRELGTIWVYYAVSNKQKFEEYRRHWMELIIKPVVVPKTDLSAAFTATISPGLIKQARLVRECGNIATLRDALLPKLLSGELRIPDAEKQVAEVL